jgi:hypothetical protein
VEGVKNEHQTTREIERVARLQRMADAHAREVARLHRDVADIESEPLVTRAQPSRRWVLVLAVGAALGAAVAWVARG